ncbi:trehalose-phosphatase [Telmatospirillum sp.]|uniref:trehalose-phosphatase n=1 Tax=Telmatospirillum sp. TaxID=2079197 RepID=UPI00284E40A4|nr:trehalose-phosphatase [Telmatospirillum sp.]MDR3439839.1 trehalose-phosphatase [Telmatospirillum sp.]
MRIPTAADLNAWALFLDIDGTLLDIASEPGKVVVPETLPPLLDALTVRLSGALALISGRHLTDIDSLFPGGRDGSGSHGAELRRAGVPIVLQGRWSREFDTLIAEIDDEARRLPGVLVERKPWSVVLHFRSAPEQAGAAISLAEVIVNRSKVPARLILGKGVVELVPLEVDKGKAIEWFMRRPPYLGRVPVFVGDDVTDEDGFHAVNRLGGISVHVGENATAARFRLTTPASVRSWLAGLDDRMEGMGNEHT